jgi:hypothetical protein
VIRRLHLRLLTVGPCRATSKNGLSAVNPRLAVAYFITLYGPLRGLNSYTQLLTQDATRRRGGTTKLGRIIGRLYPLRKQKGDSK